MLNWIRPRSPCRLNVEFLEHLNRQSAAVFIKALSPASRLRVSLGSRLIECNKILVSRNGAHERARSCSSNCLSMRKRGNSFAECALLPPEKLNLAFPRTELEGGIP